MAVRTPILPHRLSCPEPPRHSGWGWGTWTLLLWLFSGLLQSSWCLSGKGNPCPRFAQRESLGQGSEQQSLEVNARSQPFTVGPAAQLHCLFSAHLCQFFPPWCLYFQSPAFSVSVLCLLPHSPVLLPLSPHSPLLLPLSPHPLSHLHGVPMRTGWPGCKQMSWVPLCQAHAASPGLTLGGF